MKIKSPSFLVILFVFLSFYNFTFSQSSQSQHEAYIDEQGIIRWKDTNEEIQGFGVNYTAPFAHAYRTAEKLGVDLKKAIDNDVYHFTRLGFDLYRVHVWDTEISDSLGNLLENEHLKMFDYLQKQLKERGIHCILTPIAYWGNGWPEPDEDTPGFSNKYGKDKSLTDPGAIKAQQNYLKQFMEHVNPYTGIAYKDEPNIIAFEISNEPHHRGSPGEVTAFIKNMLKAIRSTGSEKPVFYNISHSIHLADAYFKGGIQGGTFQWYPTGLGFQKELEGNLLPNVDKYEIPFDKVIKKHHGAKIVYEFDAADVYKSYMYPAIARSFRKGGIQLATQFAYDPTFMAYANTEYNTHYMNLAYVPKKALGLMIASKVFHEVHMGKDFGIYPHDLEFGDFSVNYKKDLAVYNSQKEFIYSNDNELAPKSHEDLEHLAGYGNSRLVKYEGKGAYFLDKIEDGVWRLEVMPDAILVKNPFGKNSLDKTVTVINHKQWPMQLNLPGLQPGFQVSALNEGNDFSAKAQENTFKIVPGTYLLKNPGVSFDPERHEKVGRLSLRAFSAPETSLKKTYVLHTPVSEVTEKAPFQISAEVISDKEIEKVEAWLKNGNVYDSVEFQNGPGYEYTARVPEKLLDKGYLQYRIIVHTSEGNMTFPSGVEGDPGDWDFYDKGKYEIAIMPEERPLELFDAKKDADHVVGKWYPGNKLVPAKESGEAEYQVDIKKLFEKDIENINAKPVYDYSFRYNFLRKIAGRKKKLGEAEKLILKARSLTGKPQKIQVALVMDNGASFGKIIQLTPEIQEIEIPLKELEPVRTVSLPRPYPSFLPYYFEHDYKGGLKIEKVESLQFSIGPGVEQERLQQEHGVSIESVELE